MTHIIIKLITGVVVFGGYKAENENTLKKFGIEEQGSEATPERSITITKPYIYTTNNEGNIGLVPYDTFALQGEVKEITFPISSVLQYADFADCKEARDAYISIISGIVVPNKSIIL